MLSSIESPPTHEMAPPKSVMAKNGGTGSNSHDGFGGQGSDIAIAMPSGENNSSSSNSDRTPLNNNSSKKKCVTFAEDLNPPMKKNFGETRKVFIILINIISGQVLE